MAKARLKYTGVGSHFGTPVSILREIIVIAIKLEELGFICRTGDADECDKAFRIGVRHSENIEVYERGQGTPESIALALKLHPNPEAAVKYTRWLGRNPMQVAGPNLDDPSKFVVCYTPNGQVVGGTGLTMRVAFKFHVPVMNLFQYSKESVIEIATDVASGRVPVYKRDISEVIGDLGGLIR